MPPRATAESLVDDELVAAFESDGAVVLRGVFDLGWIDQLAEGVEENFADPGPWSCRYTPDDGPGGFYDDYCNWNRIDAYRRFALESGAGAVVRLLLRSDSVRFFHEHVLVKEPGTVERTPWHHDQSYYCVDGDQVASMWLPLDRVPPEAAPEYVAGSHRWEGYLAPRTFVDHANYTDAAGFAPVPDIDARRDDYEILSWALEPGDCVVFHMKTVHGAPGTEGLGSRRRAFSTRWLGDDAVFAERPFTTSPPFPDLDLAPGDAMVDDLFPPVD